MTTINIKPVTRIESHGQLTLEYDKKGSPIEAYFSTPVLRGFEAFLRGTPIDRVPWLASRVCGVCPVPHSINASQTLEKAIGLKIPKTAKNLRELLLLSQLVDSHTLSFVMLSLPDLVPTDKTSNIVDIKNDYPELFQNGMKLHTIGRKLTSEFGGRNVHPINVRVGGMNINPLNTSDYKFKENVLEARKIIMELLVTCKEWVGSNTESVQNIGSIDTHYMALSNKGTTSFMDGSIKIVDSEGKEFANFDSDDYSTYLNETIKKYTYMKMPYLKDLGEEKGAIRVNCLARSNVNKKFGTPAADKEMQELKSQWQYPFKQSLLSHWVRLIEMLYATERIEALLADPISKKTETAISGEIKDGQATCCLEAPRGTLLHNYIVKNNVIEKANLIVATQNNGLAMNKALSQAMHYGKSNNMSDDQVIHFCEMIIRAYDPCISCATHVVRGKLSKGEQK